MSENTTIYSFGIPVGASIMRFSEVGDTRYVEVAIPLKEKKPTFEEKLADYLNRVEDWQSKVAAHRNQQALRSQVDRMNREASAAVAAFNRIKTMVDALDKRPPLAFTLWQEPVIFGMDLGTADESVEGIVATPDSRSDRTTFSFAGSYPDPTSWQRDEYGAIKGCGCLGCGIIRDNKKTAAAPAPAPVDDVVDAEFDPGAVQQDTPNPERPNPITAEWFKASVGRAPSGDDLDACNCRRAGALGHENCGWDDTRDMPNFVTGRSKRPEFLLARIAELEALLNAPHASKAAEMAAGEPGQPKVMELAEELALWGPWTGKIGEDPLYLYACRLAEDIAKNSSTAPQLIIAPLYSGLCARLRGDA